MEELIDLIATDSSPAEISDTIKNILFAKSAERIDSVKPLVGPSMFGDNPFYEDQEE